MNVRERIIIGVGALLHPFAERDETLRSLRHLVDVVSWVLPNRAEVSIDLTGAHEGDDLAWWLTRLSDLTTRHVAGGAHCIDHNRCTWIVAPDHSVVATPNSDRVREIVVPLDQPANWAELERMLREYAALVRIDE